MGNSPIEWTEQTWNPIIGCSIKSPGCKNCYAMPMAARIEAMNAGFIAKGKPPGAPHYDGTTKLVNGKAVFTGKLAQAPDNILLAPLKRKKPTTYFVNSMGDLFHEDCPDEWIDLVLAAGAICPQHTLQILTKRAARMHAYMTTPNRKKIIAERVMDLSNMLAREGGHTARIKLDHFSACFAGSGPFKNIWLGVSTERQQEADERIPELLRTPAAVRFISYEPALGPLDLRPWLSDESGCEHCDDDRGPGGGPLCHSDRVPRDQQCPERFAVFEHDEGPRDADGAPEWIVPRRIKLDWVICGGESGKNARPMHPDWARSLRDQCAAAGVAFFFKQWGEWRQRDCVHISRDHAVFNEDGSLTMGVGSGTAVACLRTHIVMERMGKSAAGRHLDGVLHDAMPQADGRGRG